jgi:hypothetical protein
MKITPVRELARSAIRGKAVQELADVTFERGTRFGHHRGESCFDPMKRALGESGVRKGWLGR